MWTKAPIYALTSPWYWTPFISTWSWAWTRHPSSLSFIVIWSCKRWQVTTVVAGFVVRVIVRGSLLSCCLRTCLVKDVHFHAWVACFVIWACLKRSWRPWCWTISKRLYLSLIGPLIGWVLRTCLAWFTAGFVWLQDWLLIEWSSRFEATEQMNC